MSRVGLRSRYVNWGSVTWLLQFFGPHLAFEGEALDMVFMLTDTGYYQGSLDMLP